MKDGTDSQGVRQRTGGQAEGWGYREDVQRTLVGRIGVFKEELWHVAELSNSTS